MKIYPTEKFKDHFRYLVRKNSKYEKRVHKCLYLLDFDINHPSLRLHKLSGLEVYSVSVDMKVRILLTIFDEKIMLLDIRSHDEMYRN